VARALRFTPKQRQIFDFIREHIARHGYAPSLEEIRRHMGLAAVSTVHEHLTNMESKGLLKRRHHKARGTDVSADPVAPAVELPVLTGVPGTRFELVQSDERVPVPASMLGRGKHFAVRARGASMCDVDVRENDVLVARRAQQAVEGALVVAVVLDRMLVVRRFFSEQDRVRLDPSGGSLQPLRMPRADVQVHGIVVGLLRRYADD
jgi:repressor LexA